MSTDTSACTVGHLNHVGIAVREIEPVLELYRTLFDAPETQILEDPSRGLRAAIIVQGETHIELIQATRPDNAIGEFVAKRGEGLHHIAFNVDDIDAKLEELKAKGIKLTDEVARQGFTGRIAFIHPSSAHGALIELVQPPGAAT